MRWTNEQTDRRARYDVLRHISTVARELYIQLYSPEYNGSTVIENKP